MSPARGVAARSGALFLLIAVLSVAGFLVARRMPSAIFPSVTFPRVKIIAETGEEPAAQMMPTVTRPLEEAVRRVPGVRRVLSTTSRGSSELSVEFAWGTDMQVALQREQAEVERIRPDLPDGTRVDVEWMNTAIFPILGYAIVSETRSQADLWELAWYTLKPELIRIPGVSQVQIQGGRRREFQVRLDPRALAARRLAPADVVEALRRNNTIEAAGLVESNHELYLSLVDGRARGLETLSEMAVAVPGGVPARLADLGTLAVDDAVAYIRTSAAGRPAVLINIVRQPSASTVAIADAVSALLRARPDLVPPDVRFLTFYDQAGFVRGSVGGVRDAILIGVALAALVLLVFLRSGRIALIAVLTIPVTVAVTLLVLGAAGETVNLMTLGGLAAAVGLVADDAIVVAENIVRHREEGAAGDPAREGLAGILPPLAGSSLSTVVILVPFALLPGVAGAFFRPLALTMALALGVSFLLAALAVPAAVRRLWVGRPGGRAPRPETRLVRRAAAFLIRHPGAAAAAVLLLLAGAGWSAAAIGTDFLPEMDEGSIILDYWTPPGTSLTDTDAMLRDAETILQGLPDVESYSRRTGTQLGFFITEPNRGDYVIKLKPRARRRPVDEVIDDIRDRLAQAEPAIHTDFGQLLEDDIGDLTGGVPQPIDLKFFGDDQALLQQTARQAAQILRGVPGVEDVFDGIVIAGPALAIRPRPLAAARFGLTTEDLHAAVEPALVGTVAGALRVGERLYDVRVFNRGDAPLADLRLRIPSGALLPLSAVASVGTGPPEAEIEREDLRTYLGVTARLAGRSLGGAMREIRGRLRAAQALPAGMSLEFGGLYEQQQTSFKGLLGVLLGGLLLVAIVLLFEFGDWRAPLLTGVVALSVLAGALGALQATGMTFNISSFVGVIMMVGIAGENAVFVIHEARVRLRRGLPAGEAWAEAAARRLRAVAMTTLATAFALAPLACALGEGSQLHQPLAIAIIGGFVLSGPAVLLLLPALYARLDPAGRLGGPDAPAMRPAAPGGPPGAAR